MKLAITRLLATGGALGLATGLALAPAAQADPGPVLTNPRTTPTPVNADTGTSTDGCDGGGAGTGWLGAGARPVVSVDVPAADAARQPRFRVLDETGPDDVVLLDQDAAVANGTASLPVTGLLDGHSYKWRAQLPGAQGRAVTPWCRFQVDSTPPTVAISSADFPASGSGGAPTKYAGQWGTFTLTGKDAAPVGGEASGVACFRAALDPTPAVFKCGDADTYPADTDGTARVQLRPTTWGTNVLTVQVMDTAGNVSAGSYTFYAPSNPHPLAVPGDVTGDGVPDIVLPDLAGNLQMISGDGDDTTPVATLPARQGPGGSWAGYQVLHSGWGQHAPGDDLAFYRPQQPGPLYLMSNTSGFGDFHLASTTTVGRPDPFGDGCADTNGVLGDCPPNFNYQNWSDASQIVRFTAKDPHHSTLITEEHGDLWAYPLQGGPWAGYAERLTTTGTWHNVDLVAPGPDSTGQVQLWGRDRTTGELHAYPLTVRADGSVDPSGLADPAAFGTGQVFPTAAYPTLGSSGDLDKDGTPDLWAVTADRHLLVFDGLAQPRDLGPLK
ncbi:hypothetical protein ACFW1A_36400 [Kitasatospora sp. NPDC058965]|uniref:hypothetical protein n=1 Tax=Kitasatospora sp. NPDC058965 TaxID=3346682 RepID=UPI00368EDCB0